MAIDMRNRQHLDRCAGKESPFHNRKLLFEDSFFFQRNGHLFTDSYHISPGDPRKDPLIGSRIKDVFFDEENVGATSLGDNALTVYQEGFIPAGFDQFIVEGQTKVVVDDLGGRLGTFGLIEDA